MSETRYCDNELHEDVEAVIVYDDGTAWCEDCHDANIAAAESVQEWFQHQ